MKYYEGLIKNTEFFTTAELAKKLKMNVQVITRKVQSGDIAAYKIGKDWRIPEQSVYEWLERNSNHNGNRASIATTPEPTDKKHQTTSLPRTERHLLEYILAQFEPGISYSPREVSRVIARHHKDESTILNEFVNAHMMERVDGKYRRCQSYRLSG